MVISIIRLVGGLRRQLHHNLARLCETLSSCRRTRLRSDSVTEPTDASNCSPVLSTTFQSTGSMRNMFFQAPLHTSTPRQPVASTPRPLTPPLKTRHCSVVDSSENQYDTISPIAKRRNGNADQDEEELALLSPDYALPQKPSEVGHGGYDILQPPRVENSGGYHVLNKCPKLRSLTMVEKSTQYSMHIVPELEAPVCHEMHENNANRPQPVVEHANIVENEQLPTKKPEIPVKPTFTPDSNGTQTLKRNVDGHAAPEATTRTAAVVAAAEPAKVSAAPRVQVKPQSLAKMTCETVERPSETSRRPNNSETPTVASENHVGSCPAVRTPVRNFTTPVRVGSGAARERQLKSKPASRKISFTKDRRTDISKNNVINLTAKAQAVSEKATRKTSPKVSVLVARFESS